jgi:hypothetical protein
MGPTKEQEDAEAKRAMETAEAGATSTDAVPKPGGDGKTVKALCETLTLETHIRPEQIVVYTDGSGRKFECQIPDLLFAPVNLFKAPKKGSSPDEVSRKKKRVEDAKKKRASLEVVQKTLVQTLGADKFHQLFKNMTANGKEKRGVIVDGNVKVKVPTLVRDARKAPVEWVFDKDTNDGEFSPADLTTVEDWLNKNKITLFSERRRVIESAKDLKYRWYARKDIEEGMYKLLQEKLKETQDEMNTLLTAEQLAEPAVSDAASSTGTSEADAQSVQGDASEPPSTPRSQGAAAVPPPTPPPPESTQVVETRSTKRTLGR